jgi:ribose-phosphate pyrophosphokinase
MNPSRPSTLGIIACPGGDRFADEIIHHLKGIYKRKYEKLAINISKKYGISKTEAIRAINLHKDLADALAQHNSNPEKLTPPSLKLPVKFTRFANGEFKAEIQASIRGTEIYIVQDVENAHLLEFNGQGDRYALSVNDHVFVLFATIDAALQAGASSVTLVLPTYPFSRQHKKKGREALSASMFGRMVEFLGVQRIIALDIHSKEIENSFRRLRLENLHASYQIIRKLNALIDLQSEDIVVVSPDTGAVDRNKFYAGNLRKPLALLYKERDYSKVTKNAAESNITTIKLLGSVRDKVVFMADDLLGTGATLIKAMEFLNNEGARKIIRAASLPLFTGQAIDSFEQAYSTGLFHRIIGTNAVYHDETLLSREWYVEASISSLFAQVIFRQRHHRSLSALLDSSEVIQRLLNQ